MDTAGDGTASAERTETPDDRVRVWLVERSYSDDEQNVVILVYATPDGSRYFRKERALTSFTDVRDTTAAVEAEPQNLGDVDDPDLQERYATEAARMAASHDPDDLV
jgi:hypothetical protein